MIYEDMIGFLTDKEILEKIKNYKELDLSNKNQKWLASSYIYAKDNKLKDYQAKSFACEFTLFKTGEMFESDVSDIYREDEIDSHFCEKYKQFLAEENNEKDDLFWAKLKGYMIAFYKSTLSAKYERVRHQTNIKLSQYELKHFLLIPREKNIDKFIFLLENFDSEKGVEFERVGKAESQLVFKYGESVYDLFMSIPAEKKSRKFLVCLYQYIDSLD